MASAAALAVSGTGTTIVPSSSGTSSSRASSLPSAGAAEVDRAVVERAGDVGEVDPLEEAVGLPAATGRTARSGRPDGPATARVPGSSDWMSRKPRFASGTLSLAAANSGPFWAMQRGRKPSGSRATTSSPVAVEQDDVVRAVEPLGEAAEDPDPVGIVGPRSAARRLSECMMISVSVSRFRW